MRPLLLRSILLAAAISSVSLAQEAPKPPAADLPVKAVTLFSSGVGYFEHFGSVKGDGSTELQFKTKQINDILKSLVLQDLDGGNVSTVQYASQDPVEKTLKSFQVDITGNPPLADLLNQLRGARVSIKAQGEVVNGVVLGVEKRQVSGGPQSPAVDAWFLNVIDGANIRQVELSKVNDVQLNDAALQSELGKALEALAKARDQDKKAVTINFTGQGDRRIRLGYVVESPVWKTSYRLVLAEKESNLQGWAIIENQTDNDWNNVQLSLVSGRPISFVMDLYQPLYIPRPVVQLELFQSLRPQVYGGGAPARRAAKDQMAKMDAAEAAPEFSLDQQNGLRGGGGGGGGDGRGGVFGVAPASAPMDATASIQSLASATKLGELFQYTVGNVSLPRQKSAMIPIVTDKVEVERVSIYNQQVMPRNPLNGALVTNSTDKHLLQGPITVFDGGGYAGDAQIDNLPPKQKRLLSYGIDLQTLVDLEPTFTNSVTSGKIVKGVLQLQRKLVKSITYKAQNNSDKDKTIVVEHTFDAGWSLVGTADPFEKTDRLYRFRLPAKKGEQGALPVTEEMVQLEEIVLLPSDVSAVSIYAQEGGIPQKVRDTLIDLAKRKQAMVDVQRQIDDRTQRVAVIAQEQNRIRENMKTVDKTSQYYQRLLTKLNEQESQLEKLSEESDKLRVQLNQTRAELETFLNNLDVG